jgi:hypothetical protein
MERLLPSMQPNDITKTLILRHRSGRLVGNAETVRLRNLPHVQHHLLKVDF